MGEAIDAIREVEAGIPSGGPITMTGMRVPPEMYAKLLEECAPKTPEQFFGFEVTSDGLLAEH